MRIKNINTDNGIRWKNTKIFGGKRFTNIGNQNREKGVTVLSIPVIHTV